MYYGRASSKQQMPQNRKKNNALVPIHHLRASVRIRFNFIYIFFSFFFLFFLFLFLFARYHFHSTTFVVHTRLILSISLLHTQYNAALFLRCFTCRLHNIALIIILMRSQRCWLNEWVCRDSNTFDYYAHASARSRCSPANLNLTLIAHREYA